ncbi:MAG: hypothetical protein M1438_03180 [Deltaproteobacteria bacterium]|nr:hypothetical protein [Deltaproteobacteria bacterium]
MNLLAQYLQDFNREYLRTPEDRREAIGGFIGLGVAAVVMAIIFICRWPLWF